MTWHRILAWRGNFDCLSAAGHLLLHTSGGNYDTTALKADEFHTLVHLLQTSEEIYTDGSGKIATGEMNTGNLIPKVIREPKAAVPPRESSGD